MPRNIPLSQGLFATVDDEDYEWLMQWKWFAAKYYNTHYALTHTKQNKQNGIFSKVILMHRLILNAPKNIQVDHKDRNGLNNTRQNLRLATALENARNKKPHMDSKTGYKGVVPRRQKFLATLQPSPNEQRIEIGIFATAREAAIAYNNLALKLFGEFALLNDIENFDAHYVPPPPKKRGRPRKPQ